MIEQNVQFTVPWYRMSCMGTYTLFGILRRIACAFFLFLWTCNSETVWAFSSLYVLLVERNSSTAHWAPFVAAGRKEEDNESGQSGRRIYKRRRRGISPPMSSTHNGRMEWKRVTKINAAVLALASTEKKAFYRLSTNTHSFLLRRKQQ